MLTLDTERRIKEKLVLAGCVKRSLSLPDQPPPKVYVSEQNRL